MMHVSHTLAVSHMRLCVLLLVLSRPVPRNGSGYDLTTQQANFLHGVTHTVRKFIVARNAVQV